MVTSRLRDCFDLNFYILYFVYNFVLQKLCVTNMENREEIQLSSIIVCHHIVMS